MNDLHHERGILRRQIKDDVINHLRAPRSSRPSPQQLFARLAACHVLGRQKTCAPAAVAAEVYGNDPAVLEALAAPGMIGRSAITPAMTTVSGWAAELARLDFWQVIAPNSAYAQLSQRPG